MRKYYAVIVNMAGYMPDSENSYTDNLSQAIAIAQDIKRDYLDSSDDELPYIVSGNIRKHRQYVIDKDSAYFLPIYISIEEVSREDYLRETENDASY